jgi:hypothetical protein
MVPWRNGALGQVDEGSGIPMYLDARAYPRLCAPNVVIGSQEGGNQHAAPPYMSVPPPILVDVNLIRLTVLSRCANYRAGPLSGVPTT